MTPFESYLAHLDEWAGTEPRFLRAADDASRPVWAITYANCPVPGGTTGFTWGLSDASHPLWIRGRPELMISMDSQLPEWSLAVAFLAQQHRGLRPFQYGDVLGVGGPISADESALSAVLLFAPTDLDPGPAHIELGDRIVNLVQAYPVYEDEIPLIGSLGAVTFLTSAAVDFHDPRRASLASA